MAGASRHETASARRPGTVLPKPDKAGGYDRVVPTGMKDHAMYYRGERLHREDGPAVTWLDGTQLFYLEGKLHGTPAIIYPDGRVKDYEHGVQTSGEVPSGTPASWPDWLRDIEVES